MHPAAPSLPQCTVTVVQRHPAKAWGERNVVESERKVCLLENRTWLVGWRSCTWLGNLILAPSLKVFELTSQEECHSRQLIFPSGGMRQSSTFKRPIYGPKYKKLLLGSKLSVLESCLTRGCRLAATYGSEGRFHAYALCSVCYQLVFDNPSATQLNVGTLVTGFPRHTASLLVVGGTWLGFVNFAHGNGYLPSPFYAPVLRFSLCLPLPPPPSLLSVFRQDSTFCTSNKLPWCCFL